MAGKTPKYDQLARDLAGHIEAGAYAVGAPLPSVRELATQLGLSVTTVLRAYYQLESQGLVEAKSRSGFYVGSGTTPAAPEPEPTSFRADPSRVSMREMVDLVIARDPIERGLVQLGAAYPALDLLATVQINRLMCSLSRRLGEESGAYALPQGSASLRAQIARHATEAALNLGPDDLVVTAGCTEAMSLCLRAACRPGGLVAVASPTCFDVYLCLENLGLKALEIPSHPREGISLEALEFALGDHQVDACLLMSNFDNPLGSRLPETKKRELVALLARHQVPLVEDDVMAELYFGERRPVSCKSFDRQGLVMWCGSVSKTLAPGLRLGWAAPGRWLEQVRWLKYSASLACPTLSQRALAEFMAGPGFKRHLRKVRGAYRANLAALRRAVIRHFPPGIRVTRPQGGFLLWVELPGGLDATQLYHQAYQAGIAITPGMLFSTSERFRHCVRLNGAVWSPQVEQAVQRLGWLVDRMLAQGGPDRR